MTCVGSQKALCKIRAFTSTQFGAECPCSPLATCRAPRRRMPASYADFAPLRRAESLQAARVVVETGDVEDGPTQHQQGSQRLAPCGTASPSAVVNAAPQSLLQSGPALVAAGAFVCSFISLQIKLFDQPLPPLQVTALSSAVAWLATTCIIKATGVSSSRSSWGGEARSTREVSLLLLLRGLMGAAAVCCYYAAIEELPLSVAVALFFFNPVFCVLFNTALTGRTLSPAAVGSCLLTVLGVLTIGWHDHFLQYMEYLGALLSGQQPEPLPASAELPLAGVLTGLAAAAANATAFVTVGMIGPGPSPLCLTWWQHLVVTHVTIALLLFESLGPLSFKIGSSCISSAFSSEACGIPIANAVSALLVDLQDAWGDLADVLPSHHDMLLLTGVTVANFVGQILLNAGFQRVDAGRGSAINTSQVVFGCMWDVTLLHSAPSLAVLVGSGAVAAGVYGTTAAKEIQQLVPQPQRQQQQQEELL